MVISVAWLGPLRSEGASLNLDAGRALVVGAVAAGVADDEHGLALAAAGSHGGNEDDGGLDFHFYRR